MFGFNRVKYSVLVFLLSSAALSAQSFIAYMEGEATITRGSSRVAGEIGLSLLKGDRIETGSDSLAVLELEDRGTLKLREDTSIVLSDLGDQMSISLSAGGLFSRIRRHWRARAATITVPRRTPEIPLPPRPLPEVQVPFTAGLWKNPTLTWPPNLST